MQFAMPDIHFHALGPTRARSGEDPLVSFLLNARSAPVTVSARDVARLDSHRLQLLLVAQKQWITDDVGFEVIDMSPAFRDGLERLGLPGDHFDKETCQ
jgi:anti-anti-sigma regulatory factor